MKKLAIALAIVLGLNLISSMVSTTANLSYGQESPEPPKPDEPKPDPS